MLLLGARCAHSICYLTVRHGYEPALLSELIRSGTAATSPCTALARLEIAEGALPAPTYALQALPDGAHTGF